MNALLAEQSSKNTKVRIVTVDYSQEIVNQVGDFFFGCDFVPKKDYRGGPFYAYFYGLFNCRNDYVLHLDSDMFLGGRSPSWLNEAVKLLSSNKCLLTCSPLPGPPHPQDLIVGQPTAVRVAGPYKFMFNDMSTRIFFINKDIFNFQKLTLRHPRWGKRFKALLQGNDSYDLPERLISSFMRSKGLGRVDFLGEGKGMWSLHPPYRTLSFYSLIPAILEKIKCEDLPSSQYGFYDIVDELCDWREAREKIKSNSWWKKIIYAKSFK